MGTNLQPFLYRGSGSVGSKRPTFRIQQKNLAIFVGFASPHRLLFPLFQHTVPSFALTRLSPWESKSMLWLKNAVRMGGNTQQIIHHKQQCHDILYAKAWGVTAIFHVPSCCLCRKKRKTDVLPSRPVISCP